MIITDDTFKHDLLQADRPVLLFFTATFCAPSLTVADYLTLDDPVFDRVRQATIDVEKCPIMTRDLQIKGTPTIMVIHEGEPLASRVGTQSEDEFFDWLEETLSKC